MFPLFDLWLSESIFASYQFFFQPFVAGAFIRLCGLFIFLSFSIYRHANLSIEYRLFSLIERTLRTLPLKERRTPSGLLESWPQAHSTEINARSFAQLRPGSSFFSSFLFVLSSFLPSFLPTTFFCCFISLTFVETMSNSISLFRLSSRHKIVESSSPLKKYSGLE